MAEIIMLYARPQDAVLVGPRLRLHDRLELYRATGIESCVDALRRCIEVSAIAWTVYVDGEPVCVFGLRSIELYADRMLWIVWMLGSHTLYRLKREFLRLTRTIWSILLARCGHLVGWVDDKYDESKRWLKWLGCTLHEPEPWGPRGLPFRRFEATYV